MRIFIKYVKVSKTARYVYIFSFILINFCNREKAIIFALV
jgi:hypothetical protein